MSLGQEKHRPDLQLQPNGAQLFRQLPHSPRHIRQLLLGKQPRTNRRLMTAVRVPALLLVLRNALQAIRKASGRFQSLFPLEQLMHEACSGLASVELLPHDFVVVGRDEGGFASVQVLAIEDYLLVRLNGAMTLPRGGLRVAHLKGMLVFGLAVAGFAMRVLESMSASALRCCG